MRQNILLTAKLMEIAVVDCRDPRDMQREYTGDAVVFCVGSGMTPNQGFEVVGEDLQVTTQGSGQVRYWKVVKSELELGILVGKWAANYRVCVYTDRETLRQSEYLSAISFRPLSTLTPESPPSDVTSMWLTALRIDLLTTLEARFLTRNSLRFHYSASLMNILKNLAEGICATYSRQYPGYMDYLPSAEELAQWCYTELKRLGAAVERVEGVEVNSVECSEKDMKAWLGQQYQAEM